MIIEVGRMTLDGFLRHCGLVAAVFDADNLQMTPTTKNHLSIHLRGNRVSLVAVGEFADGFLQAEILRPVEEGGSTAKRETLRLLDKVGGAEQSEHGSREHQRV